MKKLLVMAAAVYSLNLQAAAERKPVVSAKQKFNVLQITGYNDIYLDLQSGLDSQYLSLNMFENLTKHSEVLVHLEKMQKCQRSDNATTATSTQVAELVRKDVQTMAQHLLNYEVDEVELQNVISEYNKMTAEFESLFKDAKLSTCEETVYPKYTDGERNIVVRYNDRVLFILQLTRLD